METLIYPEFKSFSKIPRLSRECIITEKIDGTNAQIHITETGGFFVGSRNRWLGEGKGNDNAGFYAWSQEHKDELLKLGPGTHYGEWWGKGIQRGYNLADKRFSLFNVDKWGEGKVRPSCCDVVPVLSRGLFESDLIYYTLSELRENGSSAAPGFMQPEGIVIFHTHSGHLYKKTLENDEKPKMVQGNS